MEQCCNYLRMDGWTSSAIGRRRFEILYLDDTKSYLRGAVSFFDDDDLDRRQRR